METTLRMFYARAVALCFFLLVFLLALGGVAFAQDAAPAAPAEPGAKDLIDLVFSSAAAGAMSLGAVVLAWIARMLPTWAGPFLDYITTSEADRWERLVTSALDRAEAAARVKYDAIKDRAGYVNAMATFLAMFNREIVQYADKNGNGIIDLIETRLPPAPTPPEATQAFLRPVSDGPKPRASNVAIDRLTAKLKGATKQ